MTLRLRPTAEETRARIIEVAEEHFRRVGYAKTAVADIAAALGMSPANVYRFFPSKGAINEAICRRVLGEQDAKLWEIARRDLPAAERLRDFVVTLHHCSKGCFTTERRMHDMVEAAMAESWEVIEQHLAEVRAALAHIVRDGIARGEFGLVDPDETADTIKAACVTVHHPALIAQCADKDLNALALRLVDLFLRALRP